MFAQFQGEDRKLAEKIQEGLDADDLKATVQAAQAALRSDNPEVRANAVEALGWFGVSALPELTAYMADPDEDVRAVAASQWEQAVQHVEKANDRFNLVAAALGTLSDADQLTSLGGQLCSVALEVIDGEEDAVVAADRRLDVIQTLADIIEGGKGAVNAEAAKEAYNTITGNEWISIEEADRYLQDPDNYEAPELDR